MHEPLHAIIASSIAVVFTWTKDLVFFAGALGIGGIILAHHEGLQIGSRKWPNFTDQFSDLAALK